MSLRGRAYNWPPIGREMQVNALLWNWSEVEAEQFLFARRVSLGGNRDRFDYGTVSRCAGGHLGELTRNATLGRWG